MLVTVERYRVDPVTGCWDWLGARSQGYGWTRTGSAHRKMYEELVGPVPDGRVLDHLCRNRACVNPAHLEPVTNRENILRGEGITALQARQTHCRAGHEFTTDNTYVVPSTGSRQCRTCKRASDAARWL